MSDLAQAVRAELDSCHPEILYGRVAGLLGMLVEIGGIEREMAVGGRCLLRPRHGPPVPCEVIGFRERVALAMPFSSLQGVGPGCRAEIRPGTPAIHPDRRWLGRVVNALGEPIDGKGPLPTGPDPAPLRRPPPPAHARRRLGGPVNLGVRAINSFLTTCHGQRMGIFSGSGVGKSTVLSMMARYTEADVAIIGLVGERGREVQEFIEDDLGPEGLARSVVVVATSDESPLMRRQAAYLTLALSEHFRDSGDHVLTLMDSLTRFAMAQREIGLSAGEPPTAKGYPPTAFSELAGLLERAGPGESGRGDITGLFSVLVEGDDHNEPVADAVRGIVDGHIVLDRAIAERGRYPAIDVLRSVSRTMPDCNTPEQSELIARARRHLATYEDMAELIRVGAYRKGTDPDTDRAIELFPQLEAFLGQAKTEPTEPEAAFAELARILGGAHGGGEAADGAPAGLEGVDHSVPDDPAFRP